MRKLFIILIGILFIGGVAWADLTINLPKTEGGISVQNQLFPFSSQTVSFGNVTSVTNSTALVGKVIRLYADQNCYIEIGNGTPVASSADCFLPASTVATFTTKGMSAIAALGVTASGTLYVTDMY